MPIVQSDNEAEAADLATADEHEEVVEMTKTKAKPAKVKSKEKVASKAPATKKAAAVKLVAKKAPPALKPASGTEAAKAVKKIVAKKQATKVAKVKPSKAKSRGGKKRGWPTGVAKNGRPARERVLKLLKQRLSPSEVARKVGVTPQRVYQIRKTA